MLAEEYNWISQIKESDIVLSECNPHYKSEALQKYLAFYHLSVDKIEDYRCGFILVKGKRQFLQCFLKDNPKGTVYLVHGYLDHSGGLSRTINVLLQENFQVIVLDLPGHGFSEGEKGMISSFDDYIDAICKGYETILSILGDVKIIGLGHSTGAALLFHACAEQKIKLERLLLVAPLYYPFQWNLFRGLLLLSGKVLPQQKRAFKKNSDDLVYRQFVKHDPLQVKVLKANWIRALQHWQNEFTHCPYTTVPVYILQGTKDTTVDWRKNLHFYKRKSRNFQVALFEGARHQLLNERFEIRELVHGRIKSFLNDLTTGAEPKS